MFLIISKSEKQKKTQKGMKLFFLVSYGVMFTIKGNPCERLIPNPTKLALRSHTHTFSQALTVK